jgi:7,8-dihydroneopterin aldolase/epimerase/oxygenase
MDIIYIRGLSVDTTIGIFDWEQNIRQTLILDIEMAGDVHTAAQQDHIKATIDYEAVSIRVTKFVSSRSFQLIETVAEHVADILLNEFQIPWIRLSVSKPGAIKTADTVGVCIERSIK